MNIDGQSDSQITVRDTVEVLLYRIGITLFAFFLVASGLEAMRISALLGYFMIPAIALSALLSGLTIHLYIKPLRWFIRFTAIAPAVLLPFVWNGEFDLIALAGFYGVFSLIAWKEVYCFNIPGGIFAPFFLFGGVFAYWMEIYFTGGGCQLIAGVFYIVLAMHKWKMPISADIGDKSLYQ